MNTNAHQTPSSAAASPHASATLSLELLEARQARDTLATLLRHEHAAMAEFLLALSDFDRRRGWEPLGHASLFAFLQHGLGLPNGPAFYRMSAARLLHRFPELIEPLRDGRLCLTTVAELAKVLTQENRAVVLPRFFRISTRDAQELVAELMPRPVPPMKTVVTAVERSVVKPAPALPPGGAGRYADRRGTAARHARFTSGARSSARQSRAGRRRHEDVEPLTADLRRLHLTVEPPVPEAARRSLAKGSRTPSPAPPPSRCWRPRSTLLLEKQARARGQVKRPRKPPRRTRDRDPDLDAVATSIPATRAAEPNPPPPLRPTRTDPRLGPPCRLGARPGALRLAARLRRLLRLDAPARARPRGAMGAGERSHGGQPSPALPCP